MANVFDKNLYAQEPPVNIRGMIERLAALGPAVVATRGPGFSDNILGTVYVGEDGGDPVLRVQECKCHVHIMWDRIRGYSIEEEDVGYGPEPVVYLTVEDGATVVRLFYPKKTLAEVKAAVFS